MFAVSQSDLFFLILTLTKGACLSITLEKRVFQVLHFSSMSSAASMTCHGASQRSASRASTSHLLKLLT